MLVLSRKQAQEIMIGDDIKITVLKVKGNTVRLGIEAPEHIRVLRGELPARQMPESAPTMANVTVVFDNSNDSTEDQVQLVPFPGNVSSAAESSEPKLKVIEAPAKKQTNTVRFRQQLPINLQRNRLKEIVNELTTPKK